MTTEPTRIVTAITILVTSLFGVLAIVGLNLDEGERNAIIGVISPLVVLIGIAGEITRSKVVSPASAGEAVALAKQEHPSTATIPDVQVAGYRAAVLASLPRDSFAIPIDWKPSVQN